MSRFQLISILMFAILASSIILLWYSQSQIINQLREVPVLIPTPPSPTPIDLTTIQDSLDNLSLRLDKLENLPTPTAVVTAKPKPVPFLKQVLTLGSASTTNLTWTRTGLEITLNNADYPATVTAYFEAGLNTVNGIAWARLTNKTTGAIINLSEVSHDTNTVTWKRSYGFKLHPGNNNYVVELRSSSGEVVYLSGSRIIIE